MLSLGRDSLMFVRECEECDSNVFMIHMKVFYGFNWNVVRIGGGGPLEEGMLCRHWSKISLLNVEMRGARESPLFLRHNPSKSCHGIF